MRYTAMAVVRVPRTYVIRIIPGNSSAFGTWLSRSEVPDEFRRYLKKNSVFLDGRAVFKNAKKAKELATQLSILNANE